MRRLRRYSFSIVVVLALIGFSALYYFAPGQSATRGAYVEEAGRTSTEQRQGQKEGNSGSSRAMVSVYSEPSDASVIIEGDTVGKTPLNDYPLEAGAYFVTVTRENYSAEDTVVALPDNHTAVYRPQLSRTSNRTYRGNRIQAEAQERSTEGSPQPSRNERQEPVEEEIGDAGGLSRSSPAQESPAQESPAQESPAQETNTDSPEENEANGSVAALANGTLQLRADPESTEVELNREAVGRTPLRLDSVPPGTHEVTFARSGYETLTKQVEVGAGDNVGMEVSLDPVTGRLRILVEPWGSIFINQQRHARAADMWYETEVQSGTHDISVRHPSLGEKTRTVKVSPGQTLSVFFDMWEN